MLLFGGASKKNIHNYLKRLFKYISFFQLLSLWRQISFVFLSTKLIYYNRLNTEADVRIQLSYIKPHIWDLQK